MNGYPVIPWMEYDQAKTAAWHADPKNQAIWQHVVIATEGLEHLSYIDNTHEKRFIIEQALVNLPYFQRMPLQSVIIECIIRAFDEANYRAMTESDTGKGMAEND